MPQSGIYRIVNTETGDCYVGSSVNFTNRKRVHFNALRRNGHHSAYMQRSFNIHGEAAFAWEIIEELAPDKKLLEERETYWIRTLQPAYNGSTVTSTRLGAKLTPEQYAQLVERMRDPEMIRKIREPQIGREFSEDHKAKIKEARANQEMTPVMLEALKRGQEIRKVVNPKPRLGMTNSEETRRKQSDAAFARPAPTEATRKKQSVAKLGKKQSEEHIKRRSEGMQGHEVSEQARRKSSETQKAQWEALSEEEQQAIIANRMAGRKPITEETRLKQSLAKKGKKQTRILTEEEHQRRSEIAKALWVRRKAAQQQPYTQEPLL